MKRSIGITAVVLAVSFLVMSCALFSPQNGEPDLPASPPGAGNADVKATGASATEKWEVQTSTAVPVIPQTGSADQPLKLVNLSLAPPEDVLSEMFYFTGGADNPQECRTFPLEDSPIEITEPEKFVLDFCWERPDEHVTLTITRPDQKQDSLVLNIPPGENREVNAIYPFDLSYPAGKYRFQLDGASGSEIFWVNARKEGGPVLYEILPASGKAAYHLTGPHHRLHMAGFSPGEVVRLLVYRVEDTLSFVGWQMVKMGEDGQAWLDANLPVKEDDQLALIAYGPITGEVHLTGDQISTWPQFRAVCPGALPTRLHGEGFARTSRGIAVYEKLDDTWIGTLTAGTVVQLHHGPYCKDGALWWFFAVPNDAGIYGYGAETSGQEYVLEPVH